MSEAEDRLLTKMKELTLKRGKPWAPCISEKEIAYAETLLEFPLPPLLRRIYLEVGDEAFGLLPMFERYNDLAMPLVDSYVELRSESGSDKEGDRRWPKKLLIIYDWGCNIYSCLDCTHANNRVVRNDNNRGLDVYALEAPSFQQWLQAVLDGTEHFDCDTAEKVTF